MQSLKVHPNRSRCKEYHFKNYPKLAFDPKWESYEKNSRIRHDGQGWLRLKVQDALAEGFTGKDVAEHYQSPGGVVVLDPLSMHKASRRSSKNCDAQIVVSAIVSHRKDSQKDQHVAMAMNARCPSFAADSAA